jgi:hypothetical protein
MSKKVQMYVLYGLLAVLAVVLYMTFRGQSEDSPAVLASNTKFEPLDIREPQLRLDLLAKLQKIEYSGTHRNIFVAAPPPPPPSEVAKQAAETRRLVGPVPPPPPPPLQVPVEFFGYETSSSGKRIAFFTSGDDVLVVPEGDSFLNRYRLVHIGTNSADVQEISSSRHATLQMVQPPPEQASAE